MKLVRKLWAKLGEKKFSCRLMTIGCTVLNCYVVWSERPPSEYVMLMSMLNGAMILGQLMDEFDD